MREVYLPPRRRRCALDVGLRVAVETVRFLVVGALVAGVVVGAAFGPAILEAIK